MSFLKSNVGAGNKEVFSRLYKALVIPHSGICCPFLASPQTSFGVRLSRIQCVTNEPQRTSAGRLVPFWSPYLQKNIDALERVQRRASKYALPISSRDPPNEERLAMLGWSSIQSRRSYLSLLECYKTIHGLNGLTCNDYFEFNYYGKTRSNHSFKLRQVLARVNGFLHSFFVRIIKRSS